MMNFCSSQCRCDINECVGSMLCQFIRHTNSSENEGCCFCSHLSYFRTPEFPLFSILCFDLLFCMLFLPLCTLMYCCILSQVSSTYCSVSVAKSANFFFILPIFAIYLFFLILILYNRNVSL